MVLVVARSYSAYVQWMRANFPDFTIGPLSPNEFVYVKPLDTDSALSVPRETLYFNVDHAKLPDWFVRRFKLIRLV